MSKSQRWETTSPSNQKQTQEKRILDEVGITPVSNINPNEEDVDDYFSLPMENQGRQQIGVTKKFLGTGWPSYTS